jgi:hypothetical protein
MVEKSKKDLTAIEMDGAATMEQCIVHNNVSDRLITMLNDPSMRDKVIAAAKKHGVFPQLSAWWYLNG